MVRPVVAALTCIVLATALPSSICVAANGPLESNQAEGASEGSPAADVVRNIAYGDDARQRMDIYRPQNAGNMPVMLYVHGGGWRKGDKSRVGNKPAFFNGKGWVFISANYRLVPDISFPDNVNDVARAINWVHRNISQYGGDPDKIFIMGHSAGAHLVSLVATDPAHLDHYGSTLKNIKGVIALDTQAYDLVDMLDGWTSDIYSKAFGSDQQVHRAASPQHHIKAGRPIPPFLICYTRGVLSERSSRKRKMRAVSFSEQLNQAGFSAELVDASDRNHGEINQWFGLDSDSIVTGAAWRFLQSLVSAAEVSGWQESLTFDPAHGDIRPVNAMNLTAHKGALYSGMATSMEKDHFSAKSSYIFVKESADSAWKLDADFGPQTSRVGVMQSIRFDYDAQGRKIPGGPVDVLVAFTLRSGRDPQSLQARIRDDDNGIWLTVDLPTPPAKTPNVRSLALHRDQVTGGQYLFVGASPAPLGIVKGAYDPQAPGKIGWLPGVELEALSVNRGSRGKWFGMASVNGHLFASSARRIFRRVDGPESLWVEVAHFTSELDNVDSAPPRGLTAVPVPDGLDGWTEAKMLLFSAGGQMWRMRVPPNSSDAHTLQVELNITAEITNHTNDQAVFTEGAFNRLRFYPEQGGFWPIGFQVVYGVEGRKPRQSDADSYRLKPQAWYLRRDAGGSYTLANIEDGQRTLFLARDFEISPFGDRTLYACGYNGSYFKGSLGTAWIYRLPPP